VQPQKARRRFSGARCRLLLAGGGPGLRSIRLRGVLREATCEIRAPAGDVSRVRPARAAELHAGHAPMAPRQAEHAADAPPRSRRGVGTHPLPPPPPEPPRHPVLPPPPPPP